MVDWTDTQLLAPLFEAIGCCGRSEGTILWLARPCRSWLTEVDQLRGNQQELTAKGSPACCNAVARRCPRLQRLTLQNVSEATNDHLAALVQSCPDLQHLRLLKDSQKQTLRWTAQRCDTLRRRLQVHRPSIELELPRIRLRADIRVDGLAPRVETVWFECVHNQPLRRLMYACCERAGEPMPSMAFRYLDARITKHQTPLQLQMRDGDVIHAFGVHLAFHAQQANTLHR